MKYQTLFAISLIGAIALRLALADDEKKSAPVLNRKPVPVDDDMHHLMEYVFEPAYKRLKTSLGEETADWKAIKGDSLTLAEASNLLLHRAPEEDGDQWIKLAVSVREQGAEVYKAARESKPEETKKHFQLLLNRCNSCHDTFADGEHQLKPVACA